MPYECRLSFISVNFNGFTDTCELIDSIPTIPGTEIIVVDNGSKEDEAVKLATRFPHIRAIRSTENLGFAGGNNLGIRAAKGEYLFFVNNDTIFRSEPQEFESDLNALIHLLNTSPHIGMVCPLIRFSWGASLIQFAGYTPLSPITLRNSSIGCGEEEHGQYNTAHPTPYAHGAAMLAKREAVDRVGFMPECYFLYYEELDWSLMFRRAGYEIWFDPSLTIYHKESQSTGQGSPLRSYYISRNRLLFTLRNIPRPRRYLTYAYLVFGVFPRDILLHLAHRRFSHALSTCRGILHFIRGEFGMYGTLSNAKKQLSLQTQTTRLLN